MRYEISARPICSIPDRTSHITNHTSQEGIMIYHIGRWLQSQIDALGFLRLLNYLSFRSIMSALTAVLIVFLMSPRFIRAMHRRNFLDRVRETGIPSAFDKAGTPTMGGALLIVAMSVSILLWSNLANTFLLLSFAALLWFGGIGFSPRRQRKRSPRWG